MPPLNLVTDAAIITKIVDGYLMVSFSGYSSVNGIKDAIESLRQVDAKVLGFVLAGVDPKAIAYSSGSYKYGKYGKYSSYGSYGYYGEHNDAFAADGDTDTAAEKKAPTTEKPVEKKSPATEKPAEKKAPATEKPADKKPADKKPADKKPADKK